MGTTMLSGARPGRGDRDEQSQNPQVPVTAGGRGPQGWRGGWRLGVPARGALPWLVRMDWRLPLCGEGSPWGGKQ